MRYQIAVAVREAEYARRLVEYVRLSPFAEKWQLLVFTQPDALIRHLQSGYPLDLLAAQPPLLEAAKPYLPANVPSASLVANLRTEERMPQLLQYQPLPDLLRGFAAMLESEGLARTDSAGGQTVVTVCSAAGRTGKTTFALHLAQAAAVHNRQPFYLNLEQWNGSAVQLQPVSGGGEAAGGLSQLLYEVQANAEKAAEWLVKHAVRHPYWRTAYMDSWSNQEDRTTLGASHISSLVETIAKAGYDYIVIEADERMDDSKLALLELSSRVAWLTNTDGITHSKNELALHYAEQQWPERFQRIKPKIEWVNSQADVRHPLVLPPSCRLSAELPDIRQWRHACAAQSLESPLYRAAVEKLFTAWAKGGMEVAAQR
ncbi:hypothetical protein [Paenibacillus protaetiae]|uniref:ParA family protein n=1 Tax=Paenibacillus protaetiae TaxID=2509456 RepID=A0A4V0YF77_9BACL|nr:hypothetical protein [Paenibacillus protaetiae]QAY66751.1 hypothetical protein ET464_10360 [Paenibacillus protaetiae]